MTVDDQLKAFKAIEQDSSSLAGRAGFLVREVARQINNSQIIGITATGTLEKKDDTEIDNIKASIDVSGIELTKQRHLAESISRVSGVPFHLHTNSKGEAWLEASVSARASHSFVPLSGFAEKLKSFAKDINQELAEAGVKSQQSIER